MKDNQKIIINVEQLFPEAARRVKILEDLRRSWAGVVGIALARNSCPEVLGVNEIQVSVKDQKAMSMMQKTKGKIESTLKKRYDYGISEDFEVKIQVTH